MPRKKKAKIRKKSLNNQSTQKILFKTALPNILLAVVCFFLIVFFLSAFGSVEELNNNKFIFIHFISFCLVLAGLSLTAASFFHHKKDSLKQDFYKYSIYLFIAGIFYILALSVGHFDVIDERPRIIFLQACAAVGSIFFVTSFVHIINSIRGILK